MSEVKKGSTRKSRDEWVEVMAAYEAASLPQREFCRTQGIPYSSFCYWRKQLSMEARSGSATLVEFPAGFAEQLTSEGWEAASWSWRVELELGSGTVLRIR